MNARGTIRIAAAACLGLAIATQVAAGGFQGFRAYTGPRLPRTAAPFVYIPTNRFTSDDPEALGYWLDTDGDAHVDAVDVALLHQRDFGLQVVWGAYVSPSDPDVVYLLGEPPDGSAPPFGLRIVVVRRTGETFTKVGGPYVLPTELQQNGDWLNTPPLRSFSGDWVHPIALRRIDGKDVVLVVRLVYSHAHRTFESRICLLVDSNGDEFADSFTPVETIQDLDAMTIDDRGNLYARHPLTNAEPYGYCDRFDRLVDTNGDRTPDTVDGTIPISRMPFQQASVTTGMADVDTGFDRFYVASVGYVDLDSRGRMIKVGDQDAILDDGFLDPYNSLQVFAAHDGYPMCYVDADLFGDYGVGQWGDFDFNGFTNNYATAPAIEIRPVFYFNEVGIDSGILNVSIADLDPVALRSGGAEVRFRDHGEYENGEAFRFRFGSTDFDALWVGANGIVSFAGPVTVEASNDNLARLHAAIAPAWSDAWDTSRVRVHAGYVPIQMSIRDGHPVKAFAIEWRGLRRPGWEPGRGVAMRLILYEDGAWRTDYGAFEANDIEAMSFVSGYAGPGSHPVTDATDLSAHSWGAGPAGTTAERVLSETFGPANLPDVGHHFVRWMGYPERLDTPGAVPEIIAPVLKNGKKITMKAAGSEIAPGAVLVVDGVDAFRLARSSSGAKWTVGARARSLPANRTIAEIFSDGAAHRIRVVNPDGEQSAEVALR